LVLFQKDPEFVSILNHIRIGNCPDAVVRSLVANCGSAQLQAAMNISPATLSSSSSSISSSIVRTKLSPYRKDVDENNERQLRLLGGDLVSIRSQFIGAKEFEKAAQEKSNTPEVLQLKVGAQVVLLRNLSFEKQLVNGTRGKVVAFAPNPNAKDARCFPLLPVVEFVGGMLCVCLCEW
jgi:ATP-dependent DNA helicase PIF1